MRSSHEIFTNPNFVEHSKASSTFHLNRFYIIFLFVFVFICNINCENQTSISTQFETTLVDSSSSSTINTRTDNFVPMNCRDLGPPCESCLTYAQFCQWCETLPGRFGNFVFLKKITKTIFFFSIEKYFFKKEEFVLIMVLNVLKMLNQF